MDQYDEIKELFESDQADRELYTQDSSKGLEIRFIMVIL